jgi:O-antigen ligase
MGAQLMLSLWLVLCLAYSPDYQAAIGSVARNLACVVVFYAAYALAMQRGRVGWIGVGVVGSALIAAISSLVQSNLAESSTGVFRAGGTFSGSVQTGTICFAGLAIFVAHMPQLSRRARWVCFAAIGICGLGILATLSRTAILGVVVFACLLVMGRCKGGRGRAKYLAYAALTLAALTVAVRFTPEEAIRARTADLPVLGEGGLHNPASGSGRSLLWQTTVAELGENSAAGWLIGHGVNGVSEVIEREMRVSVGAHNSLLQLLYDAGLVGLLLYVAGILLILRDLRQAERSAGPPLNDSIRIWFFYMVAYFLSTEMFNAYVYILGPRLLTFIVLGVLLARATVRDEPHHAPPPAFRSNSA